MVRKAENGADDLEREKSKRVGALRELWPFMRPYKGLMVAATFALVLTAGVSLILPITVGRLVDIFLESNTELLDRYFLIAIGFAGLLALGTGLRYLLVSRIGERVVADIRMAVFARVISMSPRFYETIMTGEVLSRITTDTTLILSVIGSSVSVALRNVLLFFGGLVLLQRYLVVALRSAAADGAADGERERGERAPAPALRLAVPGSRPQAPDGASNTVPRSPV